MAKNHRKAFPNLEGREGRQMKKGNTRKAGKRAMEGWFLRADASESDK